MKWYIISVEIDPSKSLQSDNLACAVVDILVDMLFRWSSLQSLTVQSHNAHIVIYHIFPFIKPFHKFSNMTHVT